MIDLETLEAIMKLMVKHKIDIVESPDLKFRVKRSKHEPFVPVQTATEILNKHTRQTKPVSDEDFFASISQEAVDGWIIKGPK
jgi:CO dehydrogenase/acetyl-CoA synthase beta subunit